MSQLLDIKRFYLLVSKQWFENRKAYLLFFLTLIAFFTGWFVFILAIGNPFSFSPNSQAVLYFAGLFIAGCLSGSVLLKDLTTRPRKINYLLLPSSTLEKLICILFYGVVIFFIGYTIIFYATDYLAIKMANSNIAEMLLGRTAKSLEWKQRFGIGEQLVPLKPVNIFSPSADLFVFYPGDNLDLFAGFFPIQSAFILGSVYFDKNGFFKTLVILLLLWLIFFILEDKILFPLIPSNSQVSRAFSTCTVTDLNGNETFYALPLWIGDTVTFILRFGITPALWLATYHRMKEKQI